MGIFSKIKQLKHAWNAFQNQDNMAANVDIGPQYGRRQDRSRLSFTTERSIISSIYARMGIDIAAVDIRHVRLDSDGRFAEEMDSGLNNCLTLEANIDQAARQFRQDIAMTLFDKGVAAIVPVDSSIDPFKSGSFDVQTLRVGEIVAWYPRHIRVDLYNEAKGRREEIILEKSFVAIVENPLYSVMNEPNSTLQRLIRKLNLLDTVDEQSSSGKLDMIIQLPYVIKSESRRLQAEQRRTDLEFQLKGSQYGIAYTDGTEKITQLNRPVENNLLKQIEYLIAMLYTQLGLTAEIMNGTANEQAMLNYNNRTIEPFLAAITEAMKRSFLTKTARTQGQSVTFFRDPFKLVPINDIAEIADKFTRNEILTANEVRAILGIKPHANPKADQLVNSNMPQPSDVPPTQDVAPPVDNGSDAAMQAAMDELDATISGIYDDLGVDENAVP
jgi:hypothetical protein